MVKKKSKEKIKDMTEDAISDIIKSLKKLRERRGKLKDELENIDNEESILSRKYLKLSKRK